MIPLAFSAPGQFWRGNLHCHSTRSDGVLDPEEVCRRYRKEGYDFICLSDHFVGQFNYPITDTTAYRRKKFTTLMGAELHTGAMQNGDLSARGLAHGKQRANGLLQQAMLRQAAPCHRNSSNSCWQLPAWICALSTARPRRAAGSP